MLYMVWERRDINLRRTTPKRRRKMQSVFFRVLMLPPLSPVK